MEDLLGRKPGELDRAFMKIRELEQQLAEKNKQITTSKANVDRLVKENSWIKTQFLAVMNGPYNLQWTWEHLENLLKQGEQLVCIFCGKTDCDCSGDPVEDDLLRVEGKFDEETR